MLKETYQRDLNHNYMIVQAMQQEYKGFSERILQENQIPGFLPCQFRRLDGVLYFYYEISAKQSLEQLFRKRKLAEDELRRILVGLYESQQMAESYLLDASKVLYSPQYLYTDFNVEHFYFCYYPDYQGDCSLESLGNFFLEHVDYQNQTAVEIAYSFHRQIMEENVSLGQLVENLKNTKERESEEKAAEVNAVQPIHESLSSDNVSMAAEIENNCQNVVQKIIEKCKGIWGKLSFVNLFIKDAKEEQQNYYEVNLDIEPPLVENKPEMEATQFFSGEAMEIHYLLYQGKLHCPNFSLEVFPFVLGKGEKGIDGRIENPMVSRLHSQIDYINEDYYITDLNSTNGTYLNGQRLAPHEQVKLSLGDHIQFAREPYLFQ